MLEDSEKGAKVSNIEFNEPLVDPYLGLFPVKSTFFLRQLPLCGAATSISDVIFEAFTTVILSTTALHQDSLVISTISGYNIRGKVRQLQIIWLYVC